jgi:hypothetical protein
MKLKSSTPFCNGTRARQGSQTAFWIGLIWSPRALFCSQWRTAAVSLICWPCVAQEALQNPPTNENVTVSEPIVQSPKRYNIPLGNGGFNFSAGLRGVYVDNVYLAHTGARDDFILVSECDAATFFPPAMSCCRRKRLPRRL